MKKLAAPFLPPEDSEYVYKPTPYHFFLSQEEEGFVRWYLAETRDATEGRMPATQWLWANGVYPSTLEAFLHAFRFIATFTGEAKFSSWLFRIVRNCAIDAYRRTRREDPTAEMPPGASPLSPSATGTPSFSTSTSTASEFT